MGLYNRAKLEADLAAAEEFDQEISRRVAEGSLSGFIAVTMGREVEKKIRGLRMKLVNAGQIMGDLKAAQGELATATLAESESQMAQAKSRVRAAWKKIRANSDGSESPEDEVSEPLRASRTHELRLDDPEAQNDIRRAQNARLRMLWRPQGRNVVIVYDD